MWHDTDYIDKINLILVSQFPNGIFYFTQFLLVKVYSDSMSTGLGRIFLQILKLRQYPVSLAIKFKSHNISRHAV